MVASLDVYFRFSDKITDLTTCTNIQCYLKKRLGLSLDFVVSFKGRLTIIRKYLRKNKPNKKIKKCYLRTKQTAVESSKCRGQDTLSVTAPLINLTMGLVKSPYVIYVGLFENK